MLADDLEAWAKAYATTDYTDDMANKSAAELRAQHALIVQMRDALSQCASWEHDCAPHYVGVDARDALAAADKYLGEQG